MPLDHFALEKLVVEAAINFGFTDSCETPNPQVSEQLLVCRERVPFVETSNVSNPRIDVVVGFYEEEGRTMRPGQLDAPTSEIYCSFIKEWCIMSPSRRAESDLNFIRNRNRLRPIDEGQNPRYFMGFEIENSRRRKLLVGTMVNVTSICYRAVIIVPEKNYDLCENLQGYLGELKIRGKWQLPDLFNNMYIVKKEHFIQYFRNKRRDTSWGRRLPSSLE